jgi:hypothetical protein
MQAGTNGDRFLLLRGIKSILRCDEAEVVSGIARYVVSQRFSLRILSALIERAPNTPIPSVIALVGWLRSFLEVIPPQRPDGLIWIARLGQERRAIEKLADQIPSLPEEFGWSELKFRSYPSFTSLVALTRSFPWRRLLRIARRLHRRYAFFRVLRVLELVAYYMRYARIFETGDFKLAVTSNHSNPHGIAFNLAARRYGVPVALISHGMPVRPVAKLSYDLALVHCEAARETYLAAGCDITRVLIHGRREDFSPMPSDTLAASLTVGIFLCKDVNEERLRALVKCLLADHRVSRILVRPHPTNLWARLDAWIESLNDRRLRASSEGSVCHDLETADIVLAGNSSVLVEAVTAGRPSGYVAGLDHGSNDLHSFVERGLIYSLGDTNGREKGTGPNADRIDFAGLLRFYQHADWSDVLRLFANIDEDEATVAVKVGAAMRDIYLKSRDPQS